MADLRSIEEIYPKLVRVKHDGDKLAVGLAAVRWLEGREIMNIVDFHLDVNYDEDRIGVRFKRAKHAKLFKEHRKDVRRAALQD